MENLPHSEVVGTGYADLQEPEQTEVVSTGYDLAENQKKIEELLKNLAENQARIDMALAEMFKSSKISQEEIKKVQELVQN